MGGASLQEHKSILSVKNCTLITAQSKMSADFKASVASHPNVFAAQGQLIAGSGETVSQNLAQAFYRKFIEEQKASEVNSAPLLMRSGLERGRGSGRSVALRG